MKNRLKTRGIDIGLELGSETRYKLIQWLDSGSFGGVFKASVVSNPTVNLSVNMDVAIKIILLDYLTFLGKIIGIGGDPLNEINKMRDIEDHINIVKYLDSFIVQGDKVCIVMEYCNQGTLKDRLQQISLDDVVVWWRQLMEGLCFIHDSPNNMIHFDLKLDNLLLHDNILKINDFGLTRRIPLGEDRIEILYHGGAIHYWSPERFGNNEVSITTKCDIWGAGIILIEMILNSIIPNEYILQLENGMIPSGISFKNIQNVMNRVIKHVKTSEYEYLIEILKGILIENPEDRLSAKDILVMFKIQDSKYKRGIVYDVIQRPFIEDIIDKDNVYNYLVAIRNHFFVDKVTSTVCEKILNILEEQQNLSNLVKEGFFTLISQTQELRNKNVIYYMYNEYGGLVAKIEARSNIWGMFQKEFTVIGSSVAER